MSFVYELPYAECNSHVNGCCDIEFVSTYLLWKQSNKQSHPLQIASTVLDSHRRYRRRIEIFLNYAQPQNNRKLEFTLWHLSNLMQFYICIVFVTLQIKTKSKYSWSLKLKESWSFLFSFFSKLLRFWYQKNRYIFLIIILKFHALIPLRLEENCKNSPILLIWW